MNRTALACLAAAAMFATAAGAQTYTISTVAGNNTSGYSGDGASATSAQLNAPYGVALNAAGALYIADQNNQRIRLVQNGNISTVAGNGTAGYSGDGAKAEAAEIASPLGIAVDASNNYYIADYANGLIRKVTSSDVISTYAGNYAQGPGTNGDGGLATAAQMFRVTAVAVDKSGNVYIADSGNNRIRKVDSSGNISTFAGTGFGGFAGDGLTAKSAQLNAPLGVAVDASGNLYIADTGNNRIRKVNVSNNLIGTLAGSSTGFAGDNGPALQAKLNRPIGVAVDAAGNVYIGDSLNARVRKVTTAGVIVTIAGNGVAAYRGDGGPATSASLSAPSGVAVDKNGTVYVADAQNNVVRMLAPPANIGNAPSISSAASASDYGAFSAVAPGTWMEIYGSNLATDSRLWTDSDFINAKAPIVLDGTGVFIAGQSAFVEYISDKQVNVQVPSNVSTGVQPVTLVTANGISGSFSVTVNPVQPGMLSPASFNIGGKQYVAAVFQDGKTFVAPPNSIPGITSRQARPGEAITIYGVGFGPVNTGISAGQIAQGLSSVSAPFQVSFGQTMATVLYAGLASGVVGQYQFNVIVPAVPANDAVPFSFTLNGVPGSQTLYTAVGN